MIRKLQNLRLENITFWLFSLTLLFIFFPVRYIYPSNYSTILGEYSDFTSFSLYLSDLLLISVFVLMIWARGMKFPHVANSIKILLIWLIIALIFHKSLSILNIYGLVRLILLSFVAYGTIKEILGKDGKTLKTLQILSILTAIQSIIAILQFINQQSLGFIHKIGESVISIQTLGVAKLVSGETTFIRGYGTFPHPNILGAFLLTGIIISLYLLYISTNTRTRVVYSTLLFINILGLTVTFSRTAYLGLAIGLALFFSLTWFKINIKRKYLLTMGFMMIIYLALSFAIFQPFLVSRATFSDTASQERGVYNRIGWKMIQKNPIIGVGMGESVLHMKQFSQIDLKPWQIQPIHNYYLIAAAELGIPGLLVLLWIFGYHLWVAWSRMENKGTAERGQAPPELRITFVSVLITFLTLMIFDHYFYTLYQGQMLLWLTLGFIAAISQGNRKS